MSSNFGKIHRKNGVFLAYDIFLDHFESIKVAGEEGIGNGLEFTVPNSDARISDQWRVREGGVSNWSLSYDIFAKWVEENSSRVCVGASTWLQRDPLAISVECMENFEGFLLGMSYIRGYAD